MNIPECRECGKDVTGVTTHCPQCGTPINPNIPKYPTFGGGSGWPIIVMWVLFIVFMAMLLISMFTFRD